MANHGKLFGNTAREAILVEMLELFAFLVWFTVSPEYRTVEFDCLDFMQINTNPTKNANKYEV